MTHTKSTGYIPSVVWAKGQRGSPGKPGGGQPPKQITSKLLKQMFRDRLPECVEYVFSIMADERATNRDRLTAIKLALEYGEGRPAVIGDQPEQTPPDLRGLPPPELAAKLEERAEEMARMAETVRTRGIQ